MILSLPLTRKAWPFLKSFGVRERAMFLAASGLVLGIFLSLNVKATVPLSDREPTSYYQLLTEAFLSGRTYLSLEPDTRLKALADPWAGAQGVPRAHDATYYNGKYYLYFGMGPVLSLMAPWRLLTRTYLREGTATGLFCAAGFLLSALLYLRCKRRYFPSISPWWTFLAVLAVGLGSFLPFVDASPRIYDVPITCAFAFCMLSANAMFSAAAATRARGCVASILLASAAWAMAITARPNYVFGLIPLWVGMALIYRWNRRASGPHSRLRFWLAALGPPALACAGIAFYNYVRFNDPREFGTTYQFSAMDMRRTKLFALENILQSATAYITKGVRRSIYYPFVDNSTDVFGVVPWAPFSLLALGLPVTLLFKRVREPAWVVTLAFMLLAGLSNFAVLLPLPFANARYEVDFLPSLTLIGLLVASVCLVELEGRPRWARVGASLGILVILLPSLFDSLASGLPAAESGPGVRALARALNVPAEMLERLEGVRNGPVEFNVEFPDGAKGRREPLVTTADGADCVFIEYLGAGRGRFGYVHMGAAGRLGKAFYLGPTEHRLRVEMGGLYPAAEHAAFSGWTEDDIAALRRRVEVSLDGKVALKASSLSYRSNGWQVSIGSMPIAGQIAPRFSGTIANIERRGIPEAAVVRTGFETGPVRLVAHLPEFRAIVGQPLVSTGVHGSGDLVYVLYLGPGKARFGHDCWNYGLFETEPVLYDPNEDQVIEVDMNSLHAPPNGGMHPFKLRFNGREIASVERRSNPSTPEEVAFGYNEIGASTAEVLFSGSKLEAGRMAAMPSGPPAFGAVHLVIKLPGDRSRGPEPLLVTGHQGAADMVYLAYPDSGHVQVGYDHWSVGGPLSDKVAVRSGENLDVEISMSSLHYERDPEWATLSASDQERLASNVVVHLNGIRVLDKPAKPYPCDSNETYVGSNPVGGSTCSAKFTGIIVSSERIGAVYLR